MINLTKSIVVQALDSCPSPTVIVDVRSDPWRIAYVNAAMEGLTGRDASVLTGTDWSEVMTADEESVESIHQVTTGTGTTVSVTVNRTESDSARLDLFIVPLYDRPGRVAYWAGTNQNPVGMMRRGSTDDGHSLREALHDARTRLRRLEKTDSATGVLVGRAFDELFQRDWAIARREQRRLSLVVFEVDALDCYRDVFGRQSADACLRKVAHAVSGSLRRAGDLVGRLADDRLVVLIGGADETPAVEFAERIADKVRGLSIHHPRSPFGRYISVSFGVATEVPDWQAESSQLIEAAIENIGRQRATADQRAG